MNGSREEPRAARDMIQERAAQIALIQDAKGLGTGVVVSADGWILTNKHVAPSVGPFRVILADGRDVHGVGVHQCPHHDLAIIKIAARDLRPFELEGGVAEDLHVGEEVYALGHPRGCRFSVARGILSNPHRELEDQYFVQADVNINPGNSGGPLVDKQGSLVGIVSGTLSNSQGLGLAVPGYVAADYVRQVRRLVRYGVVKVPEAILAQAEAERPAAEQIVRDAVSALVQAGKAAIEIDAPDELHIQLKQKTLRVDVRCKDALFMVSGLVMAMGPVERANAKLLAKILELNGTRELGGASFSLLEEGIFVGLMRPTAGLDPVEALWAVDQVLHLVSAWAQKLTTLVYETGSTWGAAQQGPYAQPPAAAPHGQPPPAGPYGQPPPGAPYGQPPAASPYGQPPPGAPYGQPPAASPYGQPPPGAPYGQPPAASPYGQPPAGPPFGQPHPAAPPYGQPPPAGPYGQPPPAGPYGQPPPAGPYGQPPPAGPYGQPPPGAPQGPIVDPGYPILTLPDPNRFR
ncbi:trypsin-like peptidase domain-containing protein [Polyangium sp. y55x31]|uniref:trypsin-like peptidase domain-containing protein n=1 Tax=Polyangium sp. y55x31 TaxID=3042688 RepID=UPI002482F039|nr:trypsin-like peptidase domain-containing protein [Polyangium sp. y55x31]MDI1479853.1 trypsin-like peptidase domain-containing protein [Polyangium sp. y55x31]